VKETVKVKGSYCMIHKRGKKVLSVQAGENLVMDVGKAQLAALFHTSPGAARSDYMAIGDGDDAVAVAQTDLQGTEHTRVGSTAATDTANEVTLEFNMTAPGAWDVKEAGIFNNAAAGPASGTMFARFLTQVVNMASGDTLQTFWTLQFGG
jgi:hypothetical protein